MEKEIGLSGLIDKIKKDGIEEADKKSQAIILQAEKKAHDIISKAREDSKKILEEAEEASDKLKKQTEESIRQSIRDSLLMLKQKIIDLFDSILKRQLSEKMSPDFLQDVIIKLIENFKKDGIPNMEILLGNKEKEALEKTVLKAFGEEARKGITFKVSPSIEKGFRIGEKDKNYYYDFTDDAIAEALKTYLNPKLIKILDA